MLNKEICMQCVEKSEHMLPPGWRGLDEEIWRKWKSVRCDAAGGWYEYKKKPPKNCPYLLEHLMKRQKC